MIAYSSNFRKTAAACRELAEFLAIEAREALIAEAELTPKPALVDRRGPGAHRDLNLDTLRRSAHSLFPFFIEMAEHSFGAMPNLELRGLLSACGKRAEQAMYQATGGSNAHRGAIWSLGLLLSAAAVHRLKAAPEELSRTSAQISLMADYRSPVEVSHGREIERRFGFGGAKEEADRGFPHVFQIGLPALRSARAKGLLPAPARLAALLAIMSSLNDTCLVYRGGIAALEIAKQGAGEALRKGGAATVSGMEALFRLDEQLLELNASPGGSADLLAATMFVDALYCLGNSDKIGNQQPEGGKRRAASGED